MLFRSPLKPPTGLVEHRRVTLTVVPTSFADLAGSVPPEDAQDMREIIEREFERVDPREWR